MPASISTALDRGWIGTRTAHDRGGNPERREVVPEGRTAPQVDDLRRQPRRLLFVTVQREVRPIRRGIATKEIEDAVPARVRAGGEGRPRHRCLCRRGRRYLCNPPSLRNLAKFGKSPAASIDATSDGSRPSSPTAITLRIAFTIGLAQAWMQFERSRGSSTVRTSTLRPARPRRPRPSASSCPGRHTPATWASSAISEEPTLPRRWREPYHVHRIRPRSSPHRDLHRISSPIHKVSEDHKFRNFQRFVSPVSRPRIGFVRGEYPPRCPTQRLNNPFTYSSQPSASGDPQV